MPRQRFTQQEIDELSARFQRRHEAQFSFGSALSMQANIAVVRADWSMSQVAYTNPQALDATGNGNHLTNNNVVFGYDGLAPYGYFDRSVPADLTKPDGGVGNWADITGAEAYVGAAHQGLTLCGWVKFDALVAATQYTLAAKWGGTTAYLVDYFNAVRFLIVSGAVVTYTATSIVAVSTGIWYFITARFSRTDNIISIQIDDNAAVTTAVPAATTIQDVANAFTLGSKGSIAGSYLDGYLSGWNLLAIGNGNHPAVRFQSERAMYGK